MVEAENIFTSWMRQGLSAESLAMCLESSLVAMFTGAGAGVEVRESEPAQKPFVEK